MSLHHFQKTWLGLFFWTVFAIAFGNMAEADEKETPVQLDLVPANLESWTFEFWMNSHEHFSSLVTLASDGAMVAKRTHRDRPLRAQIEMKLPKEAVGEVFGMARDLFNHYEIKNWVERGSDADEWYFVRLRDQAGRAIEFTNLDSHSLKSPPIAAPLLRIREIFARYGAGIIAANEVNRMKNVPLSAIPERRVADICLTWDLSLGKLQGLHTGRHQNEFLVFTDTVVHWRNTEIWLGQNREVLAVQATDTELRRSIATKILSRFQLRNIPAADAMGDRFLLSINNRLGVNAEFLFERELLVEAKVLDEWNELIDEINRRRKEDGRPPFVPPWAN